MLAARGAGNRANNNNETERIPVTVCLFLGKFMVLKCNER